MAFYQILYWQSIPSQIKVWDDFDEVKVELSEKFIAKIDQVAKEKDLSRTEDYLNQWNWSEEFEREGEVEEVAKAVKDELEKNFNF
jgi:Virulence factor